MKRFTLAAIALLVALPAAAQTQVFPNGSRKAVVAPQTNFTGTVIVERLFPANDHLPQTGGMVTFAPGARSAWHTHPAGQMLIVTSGTGWVQEQGGQKRELKAGDVVWTAPGVKHWHGATDSSAMSHITLSNMRDGKNVDWLEKVSDEQFQAK